MPLTRRLAGPIDLATLQAAHPERYPYLLQSVARDNPQARFDILFAFPGAALRLMPGAAAPDFLQQLDHAWSRERIAAPACGLPFRGGWFLYLGYELAAQIEPRLSLPCARDGLPTAFATRIPAAVVLDHQAGHSWLVAEAGQGTLLESMAEDICALPAPAEPASVYAALEEEEPARFIQGVQRIRRYIVDGDVFQVNLSRAWCGRLDATVTSSDLYRRLRVKNPGAFAGLALLAQGAIISSSPERLVRVRDGLVETRPIAGTRPRGTDSTGDHGLRAELLSHPKERAEHIMLIDLERNDLGRICRPGSVEVNELMVLESYAHVHHIVSNVRGRLRAGVTPGEVIRAVFPGGTITGCPKVRCMEIIAELEGEGRGAYTGSMGYLNLDGDLDLNILIRTLVRQGAEIQLRAGAGIVADSIPEQELAETRAKAKGLLLALA